MYLIINLILYQLGMEVDLTLQLTAPAQTGRHVSYFKLKTPEGTHFGQRLWADIRVVDDDGMYLCVYVFIYFLIVAIYNLSIYISWFMALCIRITTT
jgi:hypothetical protein